MFAVAVCCLLLAVGGATFVDVTRQVRTSTKTFFIFVSPCH